MAMASGLEPRTGAKTPRATWAHSMKRHIDQGEDDVGGDDGTAAAEEPVEAATEKECDSGADQRPAEEAHRGAGEVEEMAEGEDVGVGIFVEEVG